MKLRKRIISCCNIYMTVSSLHGQTNNFNLFVIFYYICIADFEFNLIVVDLLIDRAIIQEIRYMWSCNSPIYIYITLGDLFVGILFCFNRWLNSYVLKYSPISSRKL